MSVNVNPPPMLRIPDKLFNDPDLRNYFEQQQKILFQLWNRTGGSSDTIAGKQIITVLSVDTVLDNSAFGTLIVIDAETAAVQITLPEITDAEVGESIDIAIIDATFNTTVVPSGSETILGDSSVIMNQQFMSIQYSAITKLIWIGT